MLSLKTLAYLHPFRRSPTRSPRPRPSFPVSRISFSSSNTTMPLIPIVDHIVLFKVRDSTDPSKIETMITNLRSLISLDLATFLTAGPILRSRSAAAEDFGFTHLLYSRYRTKADLAAYSGHPSHLTVVKENVFPICDDIMAVDWAAEVDVDVAPSPGSLVRLTLAKPQEGIAGVEVVRSIDGVRAFVPDSVRVSYGENISPERAKGYEVGFISVFSGEDEADAIEGKEEVEKQKEKLRASLLLIIWFLPLFPPSDGTT
ncbi:stress-response A/B barrel domain-containing protein UP3-like [Phalaenopsis equestris]|uniref:stress-response A/B barrel domain-containing protein UP3-like n=1 Tax=Phalaenopsis equestris TaxID=78828 RepID=UPI0009E2623B|nr:stress-response A/B barrel domain-containing protein UP3-like [Phalaenopsis equestris]